MAFTHIDLIGLNKYEMEDAPIVSGNDELKTLAETSQKAGQSISIAGMRHSQGGHTALKGGRMVFTEAMKADIFVAADRKTVKVNAGATWSDLHFVLGPMGLAPLVHQSSPHFSIGGSLSVDCHGREVHEGALSNTVESIKILTNFKNKLQVFTASGKKGENPDLFFAALGGYGACGVILEATLRITKNKYLQKGTDVTNSLEELQERLIAASEGNGLHVSPPVPITMFYAWMDLTTDLNKYLKSAAVFEYYDNPMPDPRMVSKNFKNEGWSTTEALRAAWAGGRNNRVLRAKLFNLIVEQSKANTSNQDSLINFLREEINFTSTKGNAEDVDLLQEYFIPLDKIIDFFNDLIKVFPCLENVEAKTLLDAELLTCTLRIVQPYGDKGTPLLSYSKQDKVMISVALEIKVKKIINKNTDDINFPDYVIDKKAIKKLNDAIQHAIDSGGSYYLPYYPVAELKQFQKAYTNFAEWKKQADIWNPKKKGKRVFDNEFLRRYLV